MATVLVAFDEKGEQVDVWTSTILSITHAPCAESWASRIETVDGRVYWTTRGYRGWYDEHALQGGLRVVRYNR